MQITIVNVANQTVPTTKGSYQALEVTFKDNAGKVQAKKIMSFVKESKKAFDTLATASNGDVFDIKMVKDAQDKYWVWTDATRGSANAASATQGQAASAAPATNTVSKGNWETAEERAKKQVYIIRQSSLSTAVAALTTGAKAPPKQDDILALAKQFEDYVFDGLKEEKSFAASTAELEDDLFQDLPQ